MPAQFSHADAIREYLSGALVDGGGQYSPQASIGGYRSVAEAVSLGIVIVNPIAGAVILYAGGANGAGTGTLTALDAAHLTWQPPGATSPGLPVSFLGTGDTNIVEANGFPGQYLRIKATAPFTPGASQIVLSILADDVFALGDVTATNANIGVNEYRATIVRNESASAVSAWQRWIAPLAASAPSDLGQLPAGTLPGTLISSGSFALWPTTGWVQIQTSGGAIREVVYYAARTGNTLIVPGNGRALLGTTAGAGSSSDVLYSVPGVAIAIDSAGVEAFGNPIQLIPTANTAPSGVTWNMGLTAATGLQIGNLAPNQQIGLWIWRQIPAATIASPSVLNQFLDSFNAF
jgi:hypothetical protein